MTTTKAALGSHLARLRNEAGLSQSAVAEKLGVSDKAISKWETGSTCPPLDTLLEVARLYGTTASELVALIDKPTRTFPVIALSGGPCSGKSASLAFVRQTLVERGYTVFVIQETATYLMNHAITRQTLGSNEAFQDAVFSTQLAFEDAAWKAAAEAGDKAIVVCDRTVVDCAAYLSSVEYDRILSKHGMTYEDALNRYDAVVFLDSAPKEALETAFGTNPVRTESPETAHAANANTLRAWLGHPAITRIEANPSLAGKIALCADAVTRILDDIPVAQKRRTYLVRKPQVDRIAKLANCVQEEVLVTFLKSTDDETAWVERHIHGPFTDYSRYCVAEDDTVSSQTLLEYVEYAECLKRADENFNPLESTRFTIRHAGEIVRISLYSFFPYQAIIEVYGSAESSLKPPSDIQTIRDITENDVYTPRAFSRALAQGRL